MPRNALDQELPPIYISSSGSDDMGAVLDDLDVSYKSLSGVRLGRNQAGVVMLNCDGGWEQELEMSGLKKFVQSGGSIIASDHASSAVSEFTDATFSTKALPTSVTAEVVDEELADLLGQRNVELRFNMPLWHKPKRLPANCRPLLESEGSFLSSGGSVLAYETVIGNGSLVYTAFHNHAQTSDVEEALLRLLLMVPIAEATGTTVEETYTTIISDNTASAERRTVEEPELNTAGVSSQGGLTVTLQGVKQSNAQLEKTIPPSGSVTIGREDLTNFRSTDALSYISGAHFTLRTNETGAILEVQDANSTNGTRLNGRDISNGGCYSVEPGDVLSLADGRLDLRINYN